MMLTQAVVAPPAAAATTAGSPAWTASWGIAMASNFGVSASNATVRQVAPMTVGGDLVRVQFSNQYGNAPLTIAAATVALAGNGSSLVAGTLHTLTFAGSTTVTIPVGATAYSDPVSMVVHAGQSVAVSAYVPGTAMVTQHYDAGPGISYASVDGAGNLTTDVPGTGLSFPQTWDRWVSAVDVAGGSTPPHDTVVLGDSISDGYNFNCPGIQNLCTLTTPWPSVLASRLLKLPARQRVGVIDESITANTLTPVAGDDQKRGGGVPGVDRLKTDVLSQPGVDRIFLLLGTNDLWFGATASQVIAGYEQVLAQAKAAGVTVIGSTLLPRSTGPMSPHLPNRKEVWTPLMEARREKVNHWILTSGAFPAVVNMAAVIGDVYNGACQPNRMFPPYDSGDNLHPDTAGQIAMANAIPTTLLGAGSAPKAAPVVTATPTKGCPVPKLVTINDPAAFSTSTTTTSSSTSTTSTTAPPAKGSGNPTGSSRYPGGPGSASPGSSRKGPSGRTSRNSAAGSSYASSSAGPGPLLWALLVAAGISALLLLALAANALTRSRRRRERLRRQAAHHAGHHRHHHRRAHELRSRSQWPI